MNVRRRYLPHTSVEAGFTLIEVIIAVMILGAALSVIIGLQSAAVTQVLEDSHREFALLSSRRILSQIELAEGELADEDKDESLEELLRNLKAIEESELTDQLRAQLVEYHAHLVIAPLEIQGLPDKSMKRVVLQIAWGQGPRQMIEVYYFAAM